MLEGYFWGTFRILREMPILHLTKESKLSKIEIREKNYEFIIQLLSVASYGVWYNVWQLIPCGKLITPVDCFGKSACVRLPIITYIFTPGAREMNNKVQ